VSRSGGKKGMKDEVSAVEGAGAVVVGGGRLGGGEGYRGGAKGEER
jgi:hypothetical protein